MKPGVVKPASAPAKPGRKPKGEESRLGVKRQKKEADLKFEECCQAVLGARVGVWWEDDHCYYKACTSLVLLMPHTSDIIRTSKSMQGQLGFH